MSTDWKRRERENRGGRQLRAVVERNDRAPDQCTIYPAGVDEHRRMAAWISASESGFVELDTLR